MKPLKRLDTVLGILAPIDNKEASNYTYQDIKDILKTSFEVSDNDAKEISNQIHPILEKLVKDENAIIDEEAARQYHLVDPSIGYKYYRITFEGEVFNQQGGYEGNERRKIN